MKILLAGCGKVGETLVRQLTAEGHDLTVIDANPRKLETLVERYDIMTLKGNCAAGETLREAGAESADLMIAAAGSDEINLLCAVTAHGLNPRMRTIARIRNPEYAEQAYSMRSVFGLSLAFNPEKQAAVEIERLLRYPGFLKRESFARGRVEIVELKIDEKSKLCNTPLSAVSGIVKCRVLICAVQRDGTAITPNGAFVLRAGDKIFVTAPAKNLSVLLKNLGIVTHKARRVLLAGGGSVGYYLAEALSDSRTDVTIIEKDGEVCRRLAEQLPRVHVIQGDAGNRDLLASEGLSDCDALVTLTGMDELNVIVSMYGHGCGVPQIITKLDRMDDDTVLQSLPVGSVICPKKLSCNTIVRYVRAMQTRTGGALTMHTIANGQAEAIEFAVDENTAHCGKPLKEIKLKKNILIVCITRGSRIEIPGGDSSFRAGDSLIVVAGRDNVILQLNDIFE